MTQEEKVRAYDKAVREAFIAYKDEDRHLKATLERIFPELKESESYDEKIRKDIIKFLIDVNNGFYTKSELKIASWIAWLEKQGEQKQDPCEHCKDRCLNCHNFPCIDKRTFEQGKSALEAINEEKADNANKVESKFKVGDWVVRGNITAQILDVQEQYYVGIDTNSNDFTSSRFLSDDKIHLWTIEDAKSGDVLVTPNQSIFIFKEIKGATVYDYCGLYFNKFCDEPLSPNGTIAKELPKDYVPATKEQRDLLFQKMHEAGYKWDFDKKELKNLT